MKILIVIGVLILLSGCSQSLEEQVVDANIGTVKICDELDGVLSSREILYEGDTLSLLECNFIEVNT